MTRANDVSSDVPDAAAEPGGDFTEPVLALGITLVLGGVVQPVHELG